MATGHRTGWAAQAAIDRRAFLRTALGAAGALALGACRDGSRGQAVTTTTTVAPSLDPASRPTIRLPGGDFGFPSPFSYFVGPGYSRMSYIYDTLLWVGTTGKLLPWLASRWDRSPDGLTYTFELREDVRFHDGQPLTVEDVVFTYRYFLDQAQRIPPFVIGRPENIADVRATGGRSVEIRLDTPVVTFAEATASFVPIVPRHVWSAIADPSKALDPAVLVGSGPYRLESYSRGEGSYLYEANEEYFLGRPFVKRIELRQVGDELTALLAGELDAGSPATTGARSIALAPFRTRPEFGVLRGPLDFTVALYWNGEKGGPLIDPKFRQGCARAIDRADVVRRMVGDNGEPGNPGFLPPDHPFHVSEGVEDYPFDPDDANRLLEEAGYARRGAGGVRHGPDGTPLRFELLATPATIPVAELVVEALRAVGVQLTVRALEQPQLLPTLTLGAYETAIVTYGNLSGDPSYMRSLYASYVRKFFHSARGYKNPELDDLAEKQRVTFDREERKRLVAGMQRIVARDLPFLHLYYPFPFYIFNKATFDQWTYGRAAGFLNSPANKHLFVTGTKAGGLEVRPGT